MCPRATYTAVGKSPPLSFRSLTEGLRVPRRNSTAEPSSTKAGAPDDFQRGTDLQPHVAVPIPKSSSNRRRHLQLDGAEVWTVCRPDGTPLQNHQAPEARAVSDVHTSAEAS